MLLIQGDLEGGRTVLATIPEDTAERQRPETRLALLEEAADMGSLDDALAAVERDGADLDAHHRAAVLLAQERRYAEALEQAMAILQQNRQYRDEIGRLTMVRIMALMEKGSDVAKQFRRRMFNFLH